MKDRQSGRIRFGLSTKLGFAFELAIIVVAILSFKLAPFLNKILIIDTALNKNWMVADKLIDEIGEEDMAKVIEQGKKIYDSLSEEERANPTDETYQSHYEALRTPEYEAILDKLDLSTGISDVMWSDLWFLDPENGRAVYLMHTAPSDDGSYGLGYWEKVEDIVNSLFSRESQDNELDEMEYLPGWVGQLANRMPASTGNVLYVIDEFLAIADRKIDDQFCICYPLYSADSKEAIGYLCIGEYVVNYHSFAWAFAFVFAAVFIPYCIIIILAESVLVRRYISGPIHQLAQAAVDYGAEEDKQKNGEHFKQVQVRTRDEIMLLRNSMADMEGSLARYMDNLQQLTSKQERYKAEMDMSAQIQMGMLPQMLEDNGKERDFTICASIRPAREVGGDFYDFFMIDEDRIAIVIADVSGKGMPAALFTMITKIILGSEAKRDLPVAEVMRRANDQLCANNPETLFVTVWLGIYYVKEKTIRYVNAGHDFPALYRESEGRFTIVKEQNDLPMGVIEGTEFTEQILVLEPKDKLFLYTDGIPEANDPNGEMYGEERMLSALDRSAGHTQEAFFEAFNEDVFGFIGEAEQFDDMTMLLLEWK